mmetsp:Transcript_51959/g.162874  ORF Transcript_51959/g.162874 Transcript_51959/m.162874 type:complete len:254 (+) Transcript_51959:512-1273(+)
MRNQRGRSASCPTAAGGLIAALEPKSLCPSLARPDGWSVGISLNRGTGCTGTREGTGTAMGKGTGAAAESMGAHAGKGAGAGEGTGAACAGAGIAADQGAGAACGDTGAAAWVSPAAWTQAGSGAARDGGEAVWAGAGGAGAELATVGLELFVFGMSGLVGAGPLAGLAGSPFLSILSVSFTRPRRRMTASCVEGSEMHFATFMTSASSTSWAHAAGAAPPQAFEARALQHSRAWSFAKQGNSWSVRLFFGCK